MLFVLPTGRTGRGETEPRVLSWRLFFFLLGLLLLIESGHM